MNRELLELIPLLEMAPVSPRIRSIAPLRAHASGANQEFVHVRSLARRRLWRGNNLWLLARNGSIRNRFGLCLFGRKNRLGRKGAPQRTHRGASHASIWNEGQGDQQAQWTQRDGADQRPRAVRARPHYRSHARGGAG